MEVPYHPLVVHFPIALSVILPPLIVVFAYLIKTNKMNPVSWLIIISLQIMTVATGYMAMETGESEEETVERVVSKKLIHEHEEAAEIFVGSTVIVLVLCVAVFFIRKDFGFIIKMIIASISLFSLFLSYKTGKLGGELVYKHGGASAYVEGPTSQGLLPTTGLKTRESFHPIEENESLKVDEHDYGNEGETEEGLDENHKIED
jgi:uncharacterized membrane protein